MAPTNLSSSGESRNSSRELLCSISETQEQLMEQKPEKRARGSGSIFLQHGSAVWWIKFYDRGVPRRESSHSADRKAAEKLLKKRLAEVETKTYVPRENIRVDELIADFNQRLSRQLAKEHCPR